MNDWQNYFKGKKITVMGLGLLGRGIGDIKFLAEHGAVLTVTDLKNEIDLAPALEALKNYSIVFHLGGHRFEDFQSADLILKAAGIPLASPYLALAKQNNIPVLMSTALFVKFAGIKTVGVTGTRGKSTTTQMIYEILRSTGQRVHLGGNVRGVSTLALLPEVWPGDIAVLELDSWQLQGFGDLEVSPNVAVFTNLLPDHLNYYGGDMEKYFSDKANIFRWQKEGDHLICGPQIAGKIGRPAVMPLPAEWSLQIPGEHNRENAALAKAAAETLGVNQETIKKVLTNFKGVPGRLELVKEWQGIKIYNDTNSTTPDALKAALQALDLGTKNIIIIMGGADKNLNFEEVTPVISRIAREVILLPGTGTDKLVLVGSKVNSLQEAFNLAITKARPGDTILFSPAFASFGLFKNEYDRGDQFNELIKNLK